MCSISMYRIDFIDLASEGLVIHVPVPAQPGSHPCPTLDGSESIQDYYMRRYLNSSGDKGKAERAQVVYLAVRSQS